MVDFYFKLVKAGKISIEDVPDKWMEKVRERINADD